ncbi:MAG: YfiR family protein [Bacteroidetes bacterium]|nr:YfiR family protein [Bacteroidota bacterium]
MYLTPSFVSNSLLVFSKYVNWPLNHKNGDFIITIIGNPDVYKELSSNIHTMKVGSQNIIVRYYNKVNEVQDFSHILFLSENNSSTIKKGNR